MFLDGYNLGHFDISIMQRTLGKKQINITVMAK